MEREEFKLYMRKIRSFGFRVYVNKDDTLGANYAIITDGTHVALMYQAGFNIDAVSFMTLHKTCKEYGYGFRVLYNRKKWLRLKELTERRIRKAFSVIPKASGVKADAKRINKWTDFEDWNKNSGHAKYYHVGSEVD